MNENVQTKKPATADLPAIAELLTSLRQQVAGLAERVAAIEAGLLRDGQETEEEKPAPAGPRDVGLDEEVVVVLGAAIAAFLGKAPRIRQIRLIGTTSWAQQGRVTIQTSHSLPGGHTRSEH